MTRWERFYRKQLEDRELKALMERELEALRIGERSAALPERKGTVSTVPNSSRQR